MLLSLLGFLSTGCTPQDQKQVPPPSPTDFTGARDDASSPSLPTRKWQINFDNTANQRDIDSTKSPESSNVIYMGTKSPAKELPQSKQSRKCFRNLRIASPNAFDNEGTSVIEYFTVGIWKNPVLNAAELQHGPTRIPVHEVIPADDFLKASLLATNGPKGSANDINSEWLPGQAAKTLRLEGGLTLSTSKSGLPVSSFDPAKFMENALPSLQLLTLFIAASVPCNPAEFPIVSRQTESEKAFNAEFVCFKPEEVIIPGYISREVFSLSCSTSESKSHKGKDFFSHVLQRSIGSRLIRGSSAPALWLNFLLSFQHPACKDHFLHGNLLPIELATTSGSGWTAFHFFQSVLDFKDTGSRIPDGGLTAIQIYDTIKHLLFFLDCLVCHPVQSRVAGGSRSAFLQNGVFAAPLWYLLDWISPESDIREIWNNLDGPMREILSAHFIKHLSDLFKIVTNWHDKHSHHNMHQFEVYDDTMHKVVDTRFDAFLLDSAYFSDENNCQESVPLQLSAWRSRFELTFIASSFGHQVSTFLLNFPSWAKPKSVQMTASVMPGGPPMNHAKPPPKGAGEGKEKGRCHPGSEQGSDKKKLTGESNHWKVVKTPMFNIIGKEPSARGERMPVWNLHQIGPKFSGKNLCCHFVTTQCGCTLGPNCDKVHIDDQTQLEALSTADLQEVKKFTNLPGVVKQLVLTTALTAVFNKKKI